jgi:hypothetical protein
LQLDSPEFSRQLPEFRRIQLRGFRAAADRQPLAKCVKGGKSVPNCLLALTSVAIALGIAEQFCHFPLGSAQAELGKASM